MYKKGSIILSVLIIAAISGCSAAAPTPGNEPEVTYEAQSPEPTPSDTEASIFSELPEKFVFSSGAGAWETIVEIKSDGAFIGNYHDSNMGDTGPDYPNGTRYECNFSGKFTDVKKIADDEYSMRVEYINTEEEVGKETIIDGVKVITEEPYGFENAGEFRLYLPGRNTKDLPEEFINWVRGPLGWSEVPAEMPAYGLYNVAGGKGFYGD